MKKTLLITTCIFGLSLAMVSHARTTMICQTFSGQQFVWVGTSCPPGSIFISF